MEKRKQYSFDVQAAEAFGTVFRGLPWDPVKTCRAYNVTGDITPGGVPVYVFRLVAGTKRRVRFKLEHVFIDETTRTYTDHRDIADGCTDQKIVQQEQRRAFVGYDVETQAVPKSYFNEEDDAHLLSHQFYIAHDGKRVGFIILTDRRFDVV